MIYGPNGRVLTEVLELAENRPSDPTPAPGEQPSGPMSAEAREVLSTLLTGFPGVPE
ncbi:hypothetical protein [Streptomyces sp. ID05-18]|uniref:hypothetical protein n=1 Tax=Streptomyces sp. ID05-18 TaxID=3028662 RepID=UPI0029B48818|nr:hypothetical protein [Streptomyces sp. ID05-18]MDX3488360.1 hypothetical protein [Streptomyces sp. ID05-18]